ncbi:MAG: hypothetical protein R2769_03405 [Saprospiraceae bacterium]
MDEEEFDFLYGRTEYDSPEVDNEVIISAKVQYARIGDYAGEITEAMEYDLIRGNQSTTIIYKCVKGRIKKIYTIK